MIQCATTWSQSSSRFYGWNQAHCKFGWCITNHSVRKMLVKKLKKAGISNTEIIAITGHKSEDSLKHYDEVDIDDHHRISRCISSGRDTKTMVVPDNHPECSAPLLPSSETHYSTSTYGWQWPSYPSYPSYPPPPVSINPLPQVPVYNFSECTVYLGNSDHTLNEMPLKRHFALTQTLDIHVNM